MRASVWHTPRQEAIVAPMEDLATELRWAICAADLDEIKRLTDAIVILAADLAMAQLEEAGT